MDVELPNGTVIQGVPDGMSKADLVAKLKANGHDVSGLDAPAAPSGYLDRLKQQTAAIGTELKNDTFGAVRGAGNIGSTILAINSLGQFGSRADRAQGMDAALTGLGADTNSPGFKTAKFATEAAGTAGAGSALAGPVRAAFPAFANALASNGFRTGAALSPGKDLALRSAAGAAAGGAQVGLASPEDAGAGAVIGGAIPGGAKLLGAAGGLVADGAQAAAKGLMASAVKGTIKMHSKGDVETAVQTLLDYGISPTASGVNKLKGLVGDLNDKIAKAIEGSDAKIDKQKVLNALSRSRERFADQVAPTGDRAAIEGIGADFAQSYPDQIPVQLAQRLKQGTDRVLRGKFGEQGSAATEAQKDLRYGLKQGIAEAVPEVEPLNAAESRLLTTLKVAERRAMMDVNKNPAPLDVGLALASGHPVAALGLLANSKAAVKGGLARALNQVPTGTPRLNALAGPAAYRSLPRAGQQQP